MTTTFIHCRPHHYIAIDSTLIPGEPPHTRALYLHISHVNQAPSPPTKMTAGIRMYMTMYTIKKREKKGEKVR